MSFYDAIRVGASGAAGDYEIERGLKFNHADIGYLNRTAGTSTSQYKFTFSAWIKLARTVEGTTDYGELFNGYDGNNNNSGFGAIYFYSGQLRFAGWSTSYRATTRLFRDNSAWYHIIVAVDSTLGTADNRQRIYVNGVEETDFATSNNLGQNDTFGIGNNSSVMQIGRDNSASSDRRMDGYMAEINYIDGQQLTPASFGETKATTGQWIPKEYTGTYGTNGFYLKFSDNSGTTATTLGKDSSGNSNNFTPNNFVTGDAVKDTPTNNFCTLNNLNANKNPGQASFRQANLRMISSAGNRGFTTGTMKAQGKFYFEALNKSNSGFVGISDIDVTNHQSLDFYQGTPRIDGSAQSGTGQFSSGDIMGVKVDIDAKSIEFFRNGSSVYSATYTTDVEYFPFVYDTSGGRSTDCVVNFGQDSSFAGEKTAQGNTDANGNGDFYYSVPSGYLSLCSANLPDPTIKLPNKHFAAFTYTGTGTSGDVVNITNSNVDFTPDWVWVKTRDVTNDHILSDSVRGGNIYNVSSENYADQTNTQKIRAFIQNGFESGTDGDTNWSGSRPFVAWNWNAGGTDSATYRVVVVSDSGNKYRFRNSANTTTFAQSAVTLNLAEGGTYTFDQSDSSMSSHPMKLSTTANGTHGGGSSYNTGVTYELDGSTVTESAFVSGFSSATSRKLIITVAASAPTLYYFCHYHSGMGGQANTNSTLGSTNFDGTSLSVVKTNTTAGVSIVTYTGTGSLATVGHGLGVAPQVVFTKSRSATGNWGTLHTVGDPTAENRINLDDNGGYSSYQGNYLWNDTVPTSSVFTVKQDSTTNGSSVTYVAYVFSAVEGYSKFGKYTGNGSSDGPFIFTGFRSAFLMIKNTARSSPWYIFDTKRDPKNEALRTLRADVANAEATDSTFLDINSNGFKLRNSGSFRNGSGEKIIYYAFAESPFKNGRAR